MSSNSPFEIITAVVPDPKVFFWTAKSVADAAAVNLNGTETFLTNDVRTYFIIGKPAEINGLWKFRNSPSWLAIFLVVYFNKTPLFSKDLITFIISFVSLFLSAILEPLLDVFFL